MVYLHFAQLMNGYLECRLKDKPSYQPMCYTARQWALTLDHTPTRKEILARQEAKGRTASGQANTELGLIRAACRWGLYQERWEGGDPTAGIKKFKRPKREKILKREELKALLQYFEQAQDWLTIRDRALFGLQLLTGCRPGEARCALISHLRPYGLMGQWEKATTKTGDPHEIPFPMQYWPWLKAWLVERGLNDSPYLFPGQGHNQPLGMDAVKVRWNAIRRHPTLQCVKLWNYDIRRTVASTLSNDLQVDDKTIQAILNHHDGRALGHYVHKTFDSLCPVMQRWADWLWNLNTPTNGE